MSVKNFKCFFNSTMSSHYAVAKGKKVGIFPTWNECQEHTKGFKGAIYKKFSSQTEAEQFITEKTGKPFPGANPGANSFDSNSSCSNEPCGKRPKFEAAVATMGNQVPLSISLHVCQVQ